MIWNGIFPFSEIVIIDFLKDSFLNIFSQNDKVVKSTASSIGFTSSLFKSNKD